MNLKEQIIRTENLETKLKKGITNINNVIVRGGGVQSTSVAEVPENITKMLGNYKKIAIINTSGHYLKSKETTTIPININFEPKRIIITTNRPTELSIDSNNGLYVEFGGRVFLDIWSSQIEFNTKTVSIRSNHLGTRDIEVSEIIALG